jgi:hypothetical protein
MHSYCPSINGGAKVPNSVSFYGTTSLVTDLVFELNQKIDLFIEAKNRDHLFVRTKYLANGMKKNQRELGFR